MEKFVLENGVRILYEYRASEITSFCIGFEAGANKENEFTFGTAHALEHMLFKGTTSMDEDEINLKCDMLFGFNNAMTNYPYCIFYGTTYNEDFEEGFSLYSDIILNPNLSEVGFKEEIDVILQECKEWKEDFGQYCEDELFFNSFNKKRLKEIIIGTEAAIKTITIDELKRFYKKYYVPENCVISVVTSKTIDDVRKIVLDNFGGFKGEYYEDRCEEEELKAGIYHKKIDGFDGAKLQYIFDISKLDVQEIELLKVFNVWFGEGVSSRLFEEVRTKNGLAYEVYSSIKAEKGIELFTICCSTSKENINECIKIIDELIYKASESFDSVEIADIRHIQKRLKLKKALDLEKSIVLANRMAVYEIMYGDGDLVFGNIDFKHDITNKDIIKVIKNTLINPGIQVLW